MMRIVLALLALATIGAAPVDWTRTVTHAPNGAYVMGNPKAKVRLVEYLSYSCPHCAHFTVESFPKLRRDYVASGKVAVELRNAVRDRYDFAAALLARCGGAARFYPQNEALFGAQEALMTKAQEFEAQSPPPEGTPVGDLLTGIAQGSGMTALMRARGVPAAAQKKCLTSKTEQGTVLAMTKEAVEVRKIEGTPTFLINGQASGVYDWATLEPKLRAAVAKR